MAEAAPGTWAAQNANLQRGSQSKQNTDSSLQSDGRAGNQHVRAEQQGLTEIPMDEIDLVVSFDDADRQCGALPPKAKIERWSIPNPSRAGGGSAALLSIFRAGRDAVDRRVFALFLDHWRNVA
jgi:protein-tyrosine-phosphatase